MPKTGFKTSAGTPCFGKPSIAGRPDPALPTIYTNTNANSYSAAPLEHHLHFSSAAKVSCKDVCGA
ncbi:hypothetical protein ACHAW6_006144 [Cyclotella cf. meneghiniana]